MKSLKKVLLISSLILSNYLADGQTRVNDEYVNKFYFKKDSSMQKSLINYDEIKARTLLSYVAKISAPFEMKEDSTTGWYCRGLDIFVIYKENLSCITLKGNEKPCDIMYVETGDYSSFLIDIHKKNKKTESNLDYVIEKDKKTGNIKAMGKIGDEEITAFYDPERNEIKRAPDGNFEGECGVYNFLKKEILSDREKIKNGEFNLLLEAPMQKSSGN